MTIIDFGFISSNLDHIGDLLAEHVLLAVVPIVLGLAFSLVIGLFAVRFPKTYPVIAALSSSLYTIPSIALFVIIPGLVGIKILSALNIIIALTLYSIALLVRNVVDGLRAASPEVRQSALSMGYTRGRQLVEVELPIALPLIFAGLRVATVANISMVSVGALIGIGGLGELFTDQRNGQGYYTPLLVGLVLSVALALLADGLLVLLQRWMTPWMRVARQP